MAIKKQATIPGAIAQWLGQHGIAVISRYELATVAWRICKQTSVNGDPLSHHDTELDRATFNRHEATLLQNGVLREVSGLRNGAAYTLIGASVSDARVLACAIDPFCYVSHLSAMEFHGLTDRMPVQLYLSSPAAIKWRQFATDHMKKDLDVDFDAYISAGLPPLQRTTMTKLAGRPVHLVTSSHPGAFRHVRALHIRVSTLGRTFLDMLREPALCGGLSHVLSVFREHAAINKNLIFDEIDQHGQSIDKVRAGFIFENICNINDPRIDAWTACAQRGGSRKLDASADYSATFSARWALSINMSIETE